MTFRELEEGRDISESPLAEVDGGARRKTGLLPPSKAKNLRTWHLLVCLLRARRLVVKGVFVVVIGIIQRMISHCDLDRFPLSDTVSIGGLGELHRRLVYADEAQAHNLLGFGLLSGGVWKVGVTGTLKLSGRWN